MKRTVAQNGFTLVELLVALTLIGIIMVMLFGGLRFGTRAANAVGERVDRSVQIASAYDFMQRELTDARILSDPRDPARWPSSFSGELDAIDFITAPPAYLALGGFHRLHVAMEGELGHRRLTVSWRQVVRGALPAVSTTMLPSILLDQVAAVEFSYFGAVDPGQPARWQDHWTERGDLPQLVRLRIVLTGGWRGPDLIVAPRLADPMQQ